MKKCRTNNRCRVLTPAESAEFLAPEQVLMAANAAHDLKYGFDPRNQAGFTRMGWVPGYEPASADRSREGIWRHHRSLGFVQL